MRPMLATRGDRVPTGSEWCHEVKWDGMRAIVEVEGDRVRATSRNGNDVTRSFPELEHLAGLGLGRVVLDGELVAFKDGRPDFGTLAQRIHRGRGRSRSLGEAVTPVTLLVFDLLVLGERDLRREPLSVRREVLESLLLGDAQVQVPPTYDDGEMLLEATRQQGLEGVVSKRWTSVYEDGARSRAWLKFPHRARTSWVVGGWRPETGSTDRIGAVLVGEPTADGLVFRGRVGSGIVGAAGRALAELLAGTDVPGSPFLEVPKVDAAGARWVRPELVVDVESLGFSSHGRLRQPSYQGVRHDLSPDDLRDAGDLVEGIPDGSGEEQA